LEPEGVAVEASLKRAVFQIELVLCKSLRAEIKVIQKEVPGASE